MNRNESRAAATLRDPRWAAALARDRRADGAFVYSVETTGVYCRPSCGARPPRPENVRFHASPGEAERAGFRPCRRCRPDGPSLEERHRARVAELCREIARAERVPTLADLSRRAGMSPRHLHRVFKAITGLTPKAYATGERSERVRGELRRGATVTAALYEAGYASSGRFYEDSNRILGMTPSRYRAGGEDEEIGFAVARCSLGAILVAASGRGVCAVALGEDPERLARELRERFPRARLVTSDRRFGKLVAAVVRLVETPGTGSGLPLDIRGTAFQRRVWQALRRIPPGRTATYAEIARAIGAPKSARAVAGACAANPVAVAIPCHRVVRAGGNLGGYRWGVERKRELLAREAGNRVVGTPVKVNQRR